MRFGSGEEMMQGGWKLGWWAVLMGSWLTGAVCIADEPRLWSDRSGKFSTPAEFIRLESGVVRLRKNDGSVIDVPLSKLSPADQRFVARSRKTSRSRGDAGVVRFGDRNQSKASVRDANADAGGLDAIADSVVMISTNDIMGASGFGSGFVIGPNWIATNHHVVEQAMQVEVRFRDGTTTKVEGCVAIDEGRDLAILKVDSIPAGIRPLQSRRDASTPLGMSVVAIGHPQGFSHTISRGNVNALRRTVELPMTVQQDLKASANTNWIQTDAVISNGSSGGPILDSNGAVIGIATWIIPGEQLGFAVHVSHLVELMGQSRSAKKLIPFPLHAPADHPMVPLEDEVAKIMNQISRRIEEVMVRDLENIDFEDVHPAKEFVPRFRELAASQPKTRGAFQALFAALQLAATGPDSVQPQTEFIIQQLRRDHFRDEGMKYVAFSLVPVDHDAARDFMKELVQRGSHVDTKACSALALAIHLKNRSAEPMKEEDRELVLRLLKYVINSETQAELEGESILEIARAIHHAVEHLTVGVMPPALAAKTTDGRSVSLDTKPGVAKLVVFSASWCGPSERLYPHLRYYRHLYKEDQLQIIGVYGDDQQTVEQLQQIGKVSWPSISQPASDAIFDLWQVRSLPTVYLMDQDGVIRFISFGYPGSRLDQEVSKLLAPTGNEKVAGTQAVPPVIIVNPVPQRVELAPRPESAPKDAPSSEVASTPTVAPTPETAPARKVAVAPKTHLSEKLDAPDRNPLPTESASSSMGSADRITKAYDESLVHDPMPLDLSGVVNCGLDSGNTGMPLDHLGGVPRGDVTMAGIPFQILDEFVQLKGRFRRQGYPKSVRVPVDKDFDYLFMLNGCKQWQTEGRSFVATVTFVYDDGTKAHQLLTYGEHLSDYWVFGEPQDLPHAEVAWTGTNEAIQKKPGWTLTLYAMRVKNPRPEQTVREVIYESNLAGAIAPFAVAMTVANYD
ncbi:MAG: trypsin-like peptidase domain-containing protein [Rhodopirellula sp. JB055]|uniref:trypsin-like peptidase domain-containing protein n=1 Tax=Rhodopirellula sp. JB055 TaxID=3342846 RepID=UPI00370BAFFF